MLVCEIVCTSNGGIERPPFGSEPNISPAKNLFSAICVEIRTFPAEFAEKALLLCSSNSADPAPLQETYWQITCSNTDGGEPKNQNRGIAQVMIPGKCEWVVSRSAIVYAVSWRISFLSREFTCSSPRLHVGRIACGC